MMVELNERFNHVFVRLLLIRSDKGDVSTRNNLFCRFTGNKMLDLVNSQRYSILYQNGLR